MGDQHVVRKSNDGLTVVLYRGEDMVLLAFDIEPKLRTRDFVGFGIDYQIGSSKETRHVYNFLTFKKLHEDADEELKKAGKDKKKQDAANKKAWDNKESMRSPIQRFRWIHVPSKPVDGIITYRVSALYWNGDKPPLPKATLEASIDIGSKTRGDFLNVGFTRGFATSQAYLRNFPDGASILPKRGGSELKFATEVHENKEYPWLGFEARRLMFDFLDECIKDKNVLVDAYAYDFADPEIVRRLEALKDRLRIVIDNSGKHGRSDSDETKAAKLLTSSAGKDNVQRHHFWSLQHNKVFIGKRKSANGSAKPFAVVTGSTNFSLRGLYIQSNNLLLFRDQDIAGWYADAFEAGFTDPKGFRKAGVSTKFFDKNSANGRYRFYFSPHQDPAFSMEPIAAAVKKANTVFYAIAFRGAETGPADVALDQLDPQKKMVMGVADKPGGSSTKTTVTMLGRAGVPLGPAALKSRLPEPFKSEWPGGSGVHMHHKFVICDFNGNEPVVFTGSSNLASGGENNNGDNLIEIRDPKVVIAYMVEAVSIFDHYDFRLRMKRAKTTPKSYDLAEPPQDSSPCWWETSFEPEHYNSRDRQLFAG
jgi:PLD-like domain